MSKLIVPVLFNGLLFAALVIGLASVQPIGVLAYACLHIPALVWLGSAMSSAWSSRRRHVVILSDDEFARVRGVKSRSLG